MKIIYELRKHYAHYSNFHSGIYVLFAATVIIKFGNFVLPFLTLFLTKNLNFSESQVGFLVMLGAGFYVPGSILGGKLSDSLGRKKTFIINQMLAALALIPCAFSPNSIYTAAFLFIYIFFSAAAEPASLSMLMDLSHAENRNEVYSFIYMGGNVGTALGPLIAGFLFNEHIRAIFYGNFISLIVSVILIWKFINETHPNGLVHKSSTIHKNTMEKEEKGNLLIALYKRPLLFYFAIISIIYSFIHAQILFMIPLDTNKVFGDAGAKMFGFVMTTNAIVVLTSTTLINKYFKRYNPIINIVVGGIFYALGFGVLIFIKSHIVFIISAVFWTIGEILVFTNQSLVIANNTPISHRGRFNAVLPLITGAGRAVGPAIMGHFIGVFSLISGWILVTLISILAANVMYIVYYYEKILHKRGEKHEKV